MTPGIRMTSILDCVDQELWDAPKSQLPAVEVIPGVEAHTCYTPVHGYAARNKETTSWTRPPPGATRKDSWVVSYSEFLNEVLGRDGLRDMARDALSFIALLPLMQLDVLWIRQSCRLLRQIRGQSRCSTHSRVPPVPTAISGGC